MNDDACSPSERDCCALALRLIDVVRGTLPLGASDAILAPDVTLHLDELTVHGRDRWQAFVRYFRYRWRQRDLALRFDETLADGDEVTMRGRVLDSTAGSESPFHLRFRVADGRVCEVWTSRANYVAIHGRHITWRWGFVWFLIRWHWWELTRAGRE